jgi:hypothetical protein
VKSEKIYNIASKEMDVNSEYVEMNNDQKATNITVTEIEEYV